MQPKEYFMHRSIMEQPLAFRSILLSGDETFNDAAYKIRKSRSIIIVGTGSSLHAALIGRFFFEKYAGNKNVRVFSSFEFSNYTPRVSGDDTVIVISHRGYKMYSFDSIKKAKKLGCITVAITGLSSSIKQDDADFIFRTVEQEKSSAHTISLTSALAVMLRLAVSASDQEITIDESLNKLSETIISAMEKTLELEPEMEKLSKKMDFSHRIWICGGGPNAPVAMEAALKMQETSYVTAYGYEVEQMIHGPIRSADLSDDLFICISTSGNSHERMRDLVRTLHALDSNVIEIDNRINDADSRDENLVKVPVLEEELSSIVNLIALQLLSFSVAVTRGMNPDNFRSDNPDFSKMDELLKL